MPAPNKPRTAAAKSGGARSGRRPPITVVGGERTDAADLISVPDCARRIGLHPHTLYRLCRTGEFPPAVQIGAKWVVSVPRLERHLHGETS